MLIERLRRHTGERPVSVSSLTKLKIPPGQVLVRTDACIKKSATRAGDGAGEAQCSGATPFCMLCSPSQLAAYEYDWKALSSATAGGIAATWEWCRCWCRQYLGSRALRVFAFPHGDSLGALLPMVVDELGIGVLSIRLGRLVGADSVLDHCDPPVLGVLAADAVVETVKTLVKSDQCDVVTIGPLPAYHPIVAAAQSIRTRLAPWAVLWRCVANGVFTRIELPASFDDFLSELARDERKAYRRRLARFVADQQGTVEVITEPETLAAEFPQFVTMHAEQWRASGKLGHFGDWPGSVAFHHQLLRALSAQRAAWLIRVSAAGKPVAYQYVLCSPNQARAFLLARTLDAKLQPYSVGTIAFYAGVERAIEEGKRVMDVGRGHYDYKLRHGAKEVPLCSFLWVRRSLRSKLSARAFLAASRALHKAYYCLWFCRLAPRLPMPRRPLWQSWIRMRV